MLQPSIRSTIRLLASCTSTLDSSFSGLRISPSSQLPVSISKTTVRTATHKSEGRANGPKNGPGKRLGAKKTGGQYVIPGNILYRQRGTLWFPGENVGIGKDHTLFATSPGYVTYYRDPQRHKTRQFIGVVLERHHTLPLMKGVARKRRLGMFAQEMHTNDALSVLETEEVGEVEITGEGGTGKVITRLQGAEGGVGKEVSIMPARPGRMGRKTNYQIGKALDVAAQKTRPFKPGERFLAWRKRTANRVRAAEKRGMKNRAKGKKS